MTQPYQGKYVGKKRILLIEDDRSLQIALRYLLEDMGYDITIAENHEEALAAIDAGQYAIAIVDYFLNNIPARDLIAKLRVEYPKTPVLCSTAAFAEQVKLDDALQPDAFLYKPFAAAQLRDTINSLISE